MTSSAKSPVSLASPRTLVAIAALIAIAGASAAISWQAFRPQPAPPPTPVQDKVRALGRLEPQGEVLRIGGPTGDRLQRLEVAEGQIVKQGDILAYLETYDERKAERDLAASQLAEAEARLQAVTTYGNAQISAARTRVQQVERPTAFDLAAQEARIRQIEAELDLARGDLERQEKLYKDGAISQQSYDRQDSLVRQLEAQLGSAKATLVRLQSARETDKENAEAQLQAEEAKLPLSQVQVAVESARQNLQLAESRLDRTIIRAPRAGRVLRLIRRPGEAIDSGGILDLGNTQQMMAVAEIAETDIARIKVGQVATIASRNGAFAQPIRGKIAEIGWQIFKNNVLDDDPAANADARVVEVKIALDRSKPVEALTNLQVDVEIAAPPAK